MRSQIRSHGEDERSEVSFVVAMLVFWTLVGLFLVMRDPLWRLFYEGRLLGASSQSVGGTELDEKLMNRLSGRKIEPQAGLVGLEREFEAAIHQRVATEAASQNLGLPTQWSLNGQLRDIARDRAAAEDNTTGTGNTLPFEMQHPELTVALARPNQLMRTVSVGQPLAVSPPAGSTVPAELVGGWMNRIDFANIVQHPSDVDFGVGIVKSGHRTGIQVQVLLAQRFLVLDAPLPAVANKESPLHLSGKRLSSDDVSLYLKGPRDPSFSPLAAQWTGDHFQATLSWEQGAGVYALRARRTDRLSDPRPIFVK